jgi:ABC-type nickel/cobalt efflux system permease component RcnA
VRRKNMEEEKPILVPSSSIPLSITTLLRYLVVALGGYLVAKGFVSKEEWIEIASAILIIVPTLWGMVATVRNNQQKKLMASHLPDSIAKEK